MNKVKKLQKENNKIENEILEEYQEVHTDMIVYLRSSNINEYHQEIIRNDIANMLIDGQQRGETPDYIFGGDKKAFMDEIMLSALQKGEMEKFLESISLSLNIVFIMGILHGIRGVIIYLTDSSNASRGITISIVDIMMLLVLGIVAVLIVRMMVKRALEVETPESKKKSLIIGVVIVAIIVLLITVAYNYLSDYSVSIPLIGYFIGIIAVKLIDIAIDRYIDNRYNTELWLVMWYQGSDFVVNIVISNFVKWGSNDNWNLKLK